MIDYKQSDKARSCYNCMYRVVCDNNRDKPFLAKFCTTYQPRINRQALLELADELDVADREGCPPSREFGWLDGHMRDYARSCANRIREALGEECVRSNLTN